MSRYQELGAARPEQFFVERDIVPAISILQQNLGRRAEKAERKALKEEERLRSDLAKAGDMFKSVDPKTDRDIWYNEKVAEANKKSIEIVRNIKDPFEQQKALEGLNTEINAGLAKFAIRDMALSSKAAQIAAYGESYVDQQAAINDLQGFLYDDAGNRKGPEYKLDDVDATAIAAKQFNTDKFLKDKMSTFGERTGISTVNRNGTDFLVVSQGEFVDANGNINIPDQVVDKVFEGPAGELYRKRLAMGMPESLKKSIESGTADPAKIDAFYRAKAREDLKQTISKTDSYQRIIKDEDGGSKTLTPAQAEKKQKREDRVRNINLVLSAIEDGIDDFSEEEIDALDVALKGLSGASIPISNTQSGEVFTTRVKVGVGREKNFNAVKGQIKKKGDQYEYNGFTGLTPEEVYNKAYPEKRMLLYEQKGTWKPLSLTKYSIDKGVLNKLYSIGQEQTIDYNEVSRTEKQMIQEGRLSRVAGQKTPSAPPTAPRPINNPLVTEPPR